jgi:hypothetical protein
MNLGSPGMFAAARVPTLLPAKMQLKLLLLLA